MKIVKHFFSIIGGMGTIATESYVRLINHRVKIAKDQDYLNYILVNDAQIPDSVELLIDNEDPSLHQNAEKILNLVMSLTDAQEQN